MHAVASQRLDIVRELPVGVEVSGDLRAPLAAEEQQRLRDLLNRHGLLLFRKQQLSHPQQIALLEAYGPVLHAPDGVGFISTDMSKGGLGTGELAFHSDLAFTHQPFWAICLHAIDVVDGASSTRFASAAKAYQALPQSLRDRIADLQTLSVMPMDMGSDQLEQELVPFMPQQVSPAVLKHPRSGEPILYINQQHMARIEGMDRKEGAALVRELFGYLYAPENIYEHAWHNGDLVLWDNIALQHARGNLQGRGPRTLQRVVVAEKSFFDLCPQIVIDDPDYLRWINSTDPVGDRHLIEGVVARGSARMQRS